MEEPQNYQATARVLAKIRAFDASFPTGNDATILAWTEVLAPWRLSEDDLLGAVTDWFKTATRSPMVADILRLARDRRNARTERAHPDERPIIDKAAPDPTPAEIEVARLARAELDRAVQQIAARRSAEREINALPTSTCRYCGQTLRRAASGLYLHADGTEYCAMAPVRPQRTDEPESDTPDDV